MGKHVAKKNVINIDKEKLRRRASGAASGSAEAVAASASMFSGFVKNRSEEITAPFHKRLTYDKKLPESTDLYITAACMIIAFVMSFFRYSTLVFAVVSLIIVLVCGMDLLKPLFKSIGRLDFYNQEFLIFLAVLGCFCIAKPAAGAFTLCAFRLVKYIGAIVSDGCNVSLDVTMPDMVLTGDAQAPFEKALEEVETDDVVYVDREHIIPVDGVVVRGTSSVEHDNLSYIGLNEDVGPGSYVYAGDMNISGVLAVKALRSADDTVLKLLSARDNNHEGKVSDAEKRIDRLSAILSPLVMLAGLTAVISSAFTQKSAGLLLNTGIALLIVSCNSFDFSKMLYSYVYAAFRRMGITAANKSVLEKLPDCDIFAFGKSGIITDGSFALNDVRGYGCTKEDVLKFAAAAEKYSNHPIARFLKNTVRIDGEYTVKAIEEQPGKGIGSFVNGKLVLVGNAGYMQEHMVEVPNSERSGIVSHVAVDGKYAGCFVLTEKSAEGAYDCIETLKSCGAGRIVVLSGSSKSSTNQVIKDLNVDISRSELTPEDKAASIEYLDTVKRADSYVAYVGKSPDTFCIGDKADISYLFGTEDVYTGLKRSSLFCFSRDVAIVGESYRKSQQIGRILTMGTLIPIAVDIVALVLLMTGLIGINLFALAHFAAGAVSYLSIRGTDR